MKKLLLSIFILLPMLLSAQNLVPKKHLKKDLYGYWGKTKNGKEGFVIKPQFDKAGLFDYGHAFVCKKGVWSIIGKDGKVIKETSYSNVELKAQTDSNHRVWCSGKCGIMDLSNCKEVIPVHYSMIEVFQSNIYKVWKNGLQGLIEFDGAVILPTKYNKIVAWEHGGYLLKLNGKYGLAGSSGKEILTTKYDEIKVWKQGGYLLKLNGKYGLADSSGREILTTKYDNIAILKQGYYLLASNGKCSIVNASGAELNVKIHDVDDKVLAFYIDEWVFINRSGNTVDISDRVLFYTTSDSKKLEKELSGTKHLFSNGKGLFVFDTNTVEIEENAFSDSDSFENLTSVTIPNCITKIGNSAFFRCSSLTSITIPNSVTEIGNSAFCECRSLTSITIPNSVTSIGNSAFFRCSSLTSVNIPDSVTEIGNSAFGFCDGLSAFYGKFASADNRCLIVNGVLNSFAPAGLTSYTTPEGVTSIGKGAFDDQRNLTSVTIGNSVTEIGEYAFVECKNLASVVIGNSVTTIGEGAFADCSRLTNITISDSVTSIGKGAFAYCKKLPVIDNIKYADTYIVEVIDTKLESYTIKKGTRFIGDYAFYNCDALKSITIPNSVTSIGEKAFGYCDALESIIIPSSVTSIGERAFGYCDTLKSVYCKATTPPKGGASMFFSNSQSRKIYVPRKSVDAYKSAEFWRKYADDIVGYDF